MPDKFPKTIWKLYVLCIAHQSYYVFM